MITSTLIFQSDLFTDYIVYNDETHKEYLVTVDHTENTCYCTCPDFKYRKDSLRFGGVKLEDTDNHCKHIKEVMSNAVQERSYCYS